MTNKELKKLANDFVKGFGKVERMCYLLSSALQGYLSSAFKIETKLINGFVNVQGDWYGHYWLELENGKILDATAGQFQNPMTLKVFLGKMPSNYYLFQMGQENWTPSFGTRVLNFKEITKLLGYNPTASKVEGEGKEE